MKEKNQLDDMFRSKLDDFEHEPPSYVWSRIQEKQMGDKRRRTFLVWKISGVAAAILLAFLLGWQLHQSQQDLSPRLADEKPTQAVEIPAKTQSSTSGTTNQEGVKSEQESTEKKASASTNIKTETTTKTNTVINQLQAKRKQYTNQTSASISHENIEQRLDENRNSDQLQLLRSLKGEINHLLDDKQLAEVGLQKLERSRLSSIEQAVVEENAKLLAGNNETNKSNSWQVGAMLTPGYNINQSSQSMQYASNMAVPGSKENMQLGGGISVEYKTGKRWSIQSGVYYSKLDQLSSNQPYRASDALYAEAPGQDNITGSATNEASYFNTAIRVNQGEMQMNTSAGVIAIDNLPSTAKLSNSFESLSNNGILLTQTDFEQNFEYIEIPLIFRYQLIDATFGVQLLGGFNASVLIGNDAYAIDQSGKDRIGSTQDMNSVNYSTTVGFGLGYGLTKSLSLRVEPQLKYFLGSLNQNSNVTFKPYTIGVSTGLSYQF